jgi:hypothetical protein
MELAGDISLGQMTTMVGAFAGDQPIQSPQFPTLSLTAAELFTSGQTHPQNYP